MVCAGVVGLDRFSFSSESHGIHELLYSCCNCAVVVVVVSWLVFCVEGVVFPSLASICNIGYVVNRLYHGHGHGWSFCEGRAVVVVSTFSWRWCIVVW